MIIRRRHTANFTTIGNALFNDERLQADEIGVLAWLLSRPNDWEIRRPALMKRLRIGRESLRRILRNLIRFGWIVAEVTRLSNGTVHILYEVRDEPGPELSEDEARAALLLVSSSAVPGESGDDDGAGDGTEVTGEASPDADPGGGSPPTGQPEAASRLRPAVTGPIEDSLNTDSVKTESPKGVRAFSDVREAWPIEHVQSFVVCEGLHAALTHAFKEAAYQGVKPYLADCRSQSRKVCDLATYYRERRWERFTAKQASADKPFALRPGIPEAYRWREYYDRTDKQKLASLDRWLSERGSYTVPSQWPPPMPPKPAVESPSLSDDDIEAFANQ